MYKFKAISIANGLSAIFVIGCPAALGLDSALVGTWTGTIKTPQGPVPAVWSINQHGVYKLRLNGGQAGADDEGELVADSGRWRRRGVRGNESGTYSLPGAGRLITMGADGMTEWKLMGSAGASVNSRTSPSANAAAYGMPSPVVHPQKTAASSGSSNSPLASGYSPPSSSRPVNPFSSNFSTANSRTSSSAPVSPQIASSASSAPAFAAFGAYAQNQRNPNPTPKAVPQHVPGAYDPRWNPANFASQTSPQDNGAYQAPATRAYNPFAPQNSNSRPQGPPVPVSGTLQSLLFNDFPLPATGDEVQQYALPALGRAALGPKKKRDFRLIY